MGVAVAVIAIFCVSIFSFYYIKYKHIVDERLQKPLFANTAKIYAAPREVRPGQKLTARWIAQQLRDSGYSEDGSGPKAQIGNFSLGSNSITIHPGPQSYHA